MRVYLFFKIAMVFLALDSCGGCEPEDLLDEECLAQKDADIRKAEDFAESERQDILNNDELSEEQVQSLLNLIEIDLELEKEEILFESCK
ncbi:hypothetical protein NYZ99_00335 [Maribacter litopenaei]|uniref:Secreted protein n=1 Tax=Maribacter litopenaei TaxID=2976127 RepID=A0ABY5Y7Z6_9FLAO|nr:hypothetical protein [Maribacter litopenaei]UWX55132.1 hypothetical protein NYZ99_00335 [Maribacter litopenaei]